VGTGGHSPIACGGQGIGYGPGQAMTDEHKAWLASARAEEAAKLAVERAHVLCDEAEQVMYEMERRVKSAWAAYRLTLPPAA